MTEDTYFLIASLVGIGVGIFTIFSLTKYFDLTEGNEDTVQARKKNQEQEVLLVTKETELPPDWFTSTDNFNIETRAIFSKSWILLTHKSRFSKPGDYYTFTISGYSIFLILGKDFEIRAFHNVCRHRAYTVTRKESGSSTVLGCKYHGWSYDVQGRLVKAPMFDGVPGFRKEDNGLFEIPVRVGRGSGAVFVNLDAATMDAASGDNKDEQAVKRFLNLGSKKTRWVDGNVVKGGFNWKHAVDPESFNIGVAYMPKVSLLRSWMGNMPDQTVALGIFPNSTIYKVPRAHLWYSIVLMPSSPTKTQIRWDLYSTTDQSNMAAEKAVASQIEETLSTQTKAFESLLPDMHYDINEYQHAIFVQLKAHVRVEKALGKIITPTMHKARMSEKFLQAEMLCKELSCLSDKKAKQGVLAW